MKTTSVKPASVAAQGTPAQSGLTGSTHASDGATASVISGKSVSVTLRPLPPPRARSRRSKAGGRGASTAKSRVRHRREGRKTGKPLLSPPVVTHAVAMIPLSADAAAYLEERERIIANAGSATSATAVALYEITQYKDTDLLQGRYPSIREYAHRRFGFTPEYTSQLLNVGEAELKVREKFAVANQLPMNEGASQPQPRSASQYRVNAWRAVVEARGTLRGKLRRLRERVRQLFGLQSGANPVPTLPVEAVEHLRPDAPVKRIPKRTRSRRITPALGSRRRSLRRR